jgi:hypothetical protein
MGKRKKLVGARLRGGQGQLGVEIFFLVGIVRGSCDVQGEQTERGVGFLGWTHMPVRDFDGRRR